MSDASHSPPKELLELLANLSETHREHEKFYSRAPLRRAVDIQNASKALKALAAQWAEAKPSDHPAAVPFAGAEDLNPPGLSGETGILFLEGEEEPPELAQMRRDLGTVAADAKQVGEWLARAMESGWAMVGSLAEYPELSDLLGQRHRIVANDWQAAEMSTLAGRLIERSLELLERVDFSPPALRADLEGPRRNPPYLYSAAELLDHAAMLFADSSRLTLQNEPRWRAFGERVERLLRG